MTEASGMSEKNKIWKCPKSPRAAVKKFIPPLIVVRLVWNLVLGRFPFEKRWKSTYCVWSSSRVLRKFLHRSSFHDPLSPKWPPVKKFIYIYICMYIYIYIYIYIYMCELTFGNFTALSRSHFCTDSFQTWPKNHFQLNLG